MATKKGPKKTTKAAGVTVDAAAIERVATTAARNAMRHASNTLGPRARQAAFQAATLAAGFAAGAVADLLIPNRVSVTAAPEAATSANVDWGDGDDDAAGD